MDENTIILRRQGVAATLRARRGPFHIELREMEPEGRWYVEGETHDKRLFGQMGPNLASAKEIALAFLRDRTGNADLHFSDFVAAYMFYSELSKSSFPRISTDKYLSCAVYEASTDTIRLLPENYCLVRISVPFAAKGEYQTDFDAATEPFRAQIDRAVAEHDHRRCSEEDKARLAWQIGEYILSAHPDRKPVVLDSMVR